MRTKPYSFNTAASVGSAEAGSELRATVPLISHPENSVGRTGKRRQEMQELNLWKPQPA